MSRAFSTGPAPTKRPRTTVPLNYTSLKTQANLDPVSSCAIDYAQAYLRAAGGLEVTSSGVIRRALLVYVDHLAQVTCSRQEFAQARAACAQLPPDRDSLEVARGRLQDAAAEAVNGTPPRMTFRELICPPWAVDVDGLTARVDALLPYRYRDVEALK